MSVEDEIARTKRRLAELEKQKAASKEDSDSDIECIEVRLIKSNEYHSKLYQVIEAEPNYHGINQSWRMLQEFLVKVVKAKHPHIKSQDAAYKQAADYINCWNTLGYTYQHLKQKTADNDLKIQQKKISSDAFPKDLWTKLNDNREHLANNISLSFLIDRSLEHFRKILKNEPKVPIKRKTAPKYESDSDEIIIESIEPSPKKVRIELFQFITYFGEIKALGKMSKTSRGGGIFLGGVVDHIHLFWGECT